MSSAARALAERLQKDRDPEAVTRWLQQHRPDTCDDDVLSVRRAWRKTYGDDAVKSSSAYKSGWDEIVARAERLERDAAGREERAWAQRVKNRVIGFNELSFDNQHDLMVSGRLEQTAARSFTGSVVVDRMLAGLVRVPVHADLRAMPTGTAAARTPLAQEGADSATARRLRAGDDLNAAARALIDDMLATVKYPRPKVFELVCALAFMCGRSLAEVMATGQFSSAERERERAPYPWILFQATSTSRTDVIPLLCDSHSFLKGLQRLRSMPVADGRCADVPDISSDAR